MADSGANKSASSSEESKAKTKSGQAIEDFLQAPKKKRKSYVIFAPGSGMETETITAVEKFIKSQFPKLTFVTARNSDDVMRYASRNIVLSIFDDEFLTRQDTMRLVRKLKETKTDGPMPTLFLTKSTGDLVDSYRQELLPWHEVDEYVHYESEPRHVIFRKIKFGIESQNRRRAKRFKVDIPVHFQVLDMGDIKYSGQIRDFSIHGALISVAEGTHNFSTRDQIMVHLPLSKYVKGAADILRISARVRRVLISGDQAGLSWEYLSEEKIALLTRLLFAIVDSSLVKSANETRAKIAKNPSPNLSETR
jgi:hypothetical protein